MTFGSLFAGIGGMDAGLERAGMTPLWQVENEPYCVKVLEKHWPGVKRYGDIKVVDWASVERPDLVCGGFPCQPVSVAGKRLGTSDDRWLWPEFLRCLRILRPRYILLENTPGLLSLGFDEVEASLASLGLCCEWGCLPASAFGLPQEGYRVFAFATTHGQGLALWEAFRSHRQAQQPATLRTVLEAVWARLRARGHGDHHGAPGRLDPHRKSRIRAIGNAVAPPVAEWLGRRILEAHERT